MGYRILGRLHAGLHHTAVRALRAERGQGTVEYVALILLVAAVLAAVVAATKTKKFGTSGIAETIVKQTKAAMNGIK